MEEGEAPSCWPEWLIKTSRMRRCRVNRIPRARSHLAPRLARESEFLGFVDLLKASKPGKGENTYLVRFQESVYHLAKQKDPKLDSVRV